MPPIPPRPPKVSADLAKGNLTVFLGDSNTAGTDGTYSGGQFQMGPSSYATWASLLSGGRIRMLANKGVGGETSTQILARVDDVIALSPDWCLVMMGTNDMTGYAAAPAATLATLKSNIEAAERQLRGVGINVVLCTILPNGTAQYRPGIIRANAWIRWYCQTRGVHLLDLYAQMVDPAQADTWRSGYAHGDGVHFSQAGAKAAGSYVATALAPLLPLHTPTLCSSNVTGDDPNLLVNGIFTGDTNADGIANSWGETGSGGSVTWSLETDSAIVGQWQVLTVASSGARSLAQGVSPAADTYADGDVLAFAGRLTTEIEAGSMTCTVRLTFTATGGSFYLAPVLSITRNLSNAVFYGQMAVPAGTTLVQAQISNGAGTGVIKVAQVSLYNLTTLGLTP